VKRRHRLLGFKDYTIGPNYVHRDLHILGMSIVRALQCDAYFLRRFFGFGNPTITTNTHATHSTPGGGGGGGGGGGVVAIATTTAPTATGSISTTTTSSSGGAALSSTTVGPMLLSSPNSVSPSPLFGRVIQLYMSHYERVCVTILADIGNIHSSHNISRSPLASPIPFVNRCWTSTIIDWMERF
jgi:hypothetical protein